MTILPLFGLVWQKLEEQNQEFFKGYHLRLMVKEQIMEFNKLLDRQAALMHQLGPTTVNFQPNKSNGSHIPPSKPIFISSIHSTSLTF